ncbi:MAG: hypothetical protein OHK0015_00430 [Chloroflexi bacterium OHK40]
MWRTIMDAMGITATLACLRAVGGLGSPASPRAGGGLGSRFRGNDTLAHLWHARAGGLRFR